MRPTAAMLASGEPSPALSALLAAPGAVASYDRVPIMAASGVFTLDTAAEAFNLHSAQVCACVRGRRVGWVWVGGLVGGSVGEGLMLL